MIEPNRLTPPGERAARERVEALFARIDRLTGYDILTLPIPRADLEQREIDLAELENVADRHGRGELLDRARAEVRDLLMARVTGEAMPYGQAGLVPSTGPVEDRVRIVSALEDAVAVAVTEDLLEPDVAEALAGPARRALGVPATEWAQAPEPSPEPAWAPSAEDWIEAANDTPASADERIPGFRAARRLGLSAVALGLIPLAVAGGLVQDDPLVGVVLGLGGVAVVLLLWVTFLAPRSPG